MPAESHQRTFQQGLQYLRQNHLAEASNAFRALFKTEPDEPCYLSYYGLIVALHEKNFQDGINFCRAAILRASCEAELYVNLCRVYARGGQRKKALETLVEGLKFASDKPSILTEMRRMGCRRKPVLRFLPRDHFLNKSLGKFTYQFRKTAASPTELRR